MDRGQDERAQFGNVRHVAEDGPLLGVGVDAPLQCRIVRGGDDQEAAVKVGRLVGAVEPRQVRAAVEQRARLLGSERAASDDEAAAAGQVEARRVVLLLRH
jgi:hypothetical protein